jgi:hypothetical protein
MNKDYDFFMENRAKIIAGHEDSYVVIKDLTILGYYDSEATALVAMQDHKLGSFIIQKCISEKNDIIEFYSMGIVFA